MPRLNLRQRPTRVFAEAATSWSRRRHVYQRGDSKYRKCDESDPPRPSLADPENQPCSEKHFKFNLSNCFQPIGRRRTANGTVSDTNVLYFGKCSNNEDASD